MKILLMLLVSVFALSSVSSAAGHKRVSINKVIEAIEEDPEKAMKDYALFESRFAVEPDDGVLNGKTGVVKDYSLRYEANHMGRLEDGKKYKFSCKLEKFKNSKGIDSVRIRITEILQ